ncbi:MAG: hypothetical protein PUF12_01150 [Thermoflexaceae bacterium]|nr:hypothetical protein [Thermoflexaceae bacterium]
MEKKKNKWFNIKLYLDGLRQLKLIGIMSAIIMACAAFLIPMGDQLQNANYVKYVNGRPVGSVGRIVSYGILELNPLIVLTFLVIVPLMTLYLFHFLNKRNACDFYHSIPDTRESIFVSFGLAILTWNIGILLESILISAISSGIFSYVELDAGTIPVVFCASAAACIFMYGVFLIAMSLTGTSFTNLTVAVMILIVPRLVATVFMAIISDSISVIPFQFGGSILDDRLNVITNLFTGYMIRGEYQGISMWSSVLYTLVVSIIYCVAGCYFFKKRKSEAATCAALNSKLQCVLRLIPAMMICLIPIAMIFETIIKSYSLDDEEIFGIVVLYIIAIIGYFLYELVTTKRLKNLIKAIPGLLWLVVFNAGFILALFASYHVMLNDVPKVESVDSVCLEIDGDMYAYDSRNDYYQEQISKIALTSPEIKNLVISELSRNVEAIKADASLWNYGIEQNIDTYNYGRSNRMILSVKIDCGITSKYRRIYLSQPAYSELTKLLANNEQINEVLYENVDFKDISAMYFSYADVEIPLETMYQIYCSYNEELAKLSFEDTFHIIMWGDYPDDAEWYDHLWITLKNGEQMHIVINDMFPETLKLYFETVNENVVEEPLDKFMAILDECSDADGTSAESLEVNGQIHFLLKSDNHISASAWFFAYKDKNNKDISLECDFTENGQRILRQIQEKLKECKEPDVMNQNKILEVEFHGYDIHNDFQYDIVKYYEIDEELLKLIRIFGGYDTEAEENSEAVETDEIMEITGYLNGWADNHTIEISTQEQGIMTLQVLDEEAAKELAKANPGDIVNLFVDCNKLENGSECYTVVYVNEIVPMTGN